MTCLTICDNIGLWVKYISGNFHCTVEGFFSVSATALGQSITIGITDSTGSATFQCQLDNQAFVSCK